MLRARNLCSVIDLPLVVEDVALVEPEEEERAQTLVATAFVNTDVHSHSFLGNDLLQAYVIGVIQNTDFDEDSLSKRVELSKCLAKAIPPCLSFFKSNRLKDKSNLINH